MSLPCFSLLPPTHSLLTIAMLSSTLLIAGAVLLAGQASAHAASDLAVAVVEEQFKSALLVPVRRATPPPHSPSRY